MWALFLNYNCILFAGSLPDSSVFRASGLGRAMHDGTINLPEPFPLPGTNVNFPHYIVGDEAFPLRLDLLRPYSRRSSRGEAARIFNYRLSRGRLTIENAFGILSSRCVAVVSQIFPFGERLICFLIFLGQP